MKTTLTVIACAAFALGQMHAQTTTTTTTTTTVTSNGVLTSFTPGSAFVLKESSGPVTYTYGDTVQYVTKKGAVLTPEQVKTHVKIGTPVNVAYRTVDDDRVIERIEIDDDELDIEIGD